MTIATINLKPRQTHASAESVGRFIEAAGTAVKVKTDFILLPEGITAVGTGKPYVEVAEPIPGPTTMRLQHRRPDRPGGQRRW